MKECSFFIDKLKKKIATFEQCVYLQYLLNHTPILRKLSKSDCGLQEERAYQARAQNTRVRYKMVYEDVHLPINAVYIIREHNNLRLHSFLLQCSRVLHAQQIKPITCLHDLCGYREMWWKYEKKILVWENKIKVARRYK